MSGGPEGNWRFLVMVAEAQPRRLWRTAVVWWSWKRKVGQLTMENDFLKKALQHFKVHHPPAVVSGGDACLKKSSKAPRKAKP
jgi:hypothetical protein